MTYFNFGIKLFISFNFDVGQTLNQAFTEEEGGRRTILINSPSK